MRFIGFIKDENGNYYSENRKVRYIMLEGTELFEFLKSTEGQSRCFYMEKYEDGSKCIIETNLHKISEINKDKNHSAYLAFWEKETGYEIVLANAICDEAESETELIDTLSYENDESVEDKALRKVAVTDLRKVLCKLSQDEYDLIYCLFLKKGTLTLTKYGERCGLTAMGVKKRRDRILEKLKNFLCF